LSMAMALLQSSICAVQISISSNFLLQVFISSLS
jgi:hypothetical protein